MNNPSRRGGFAALTSGLKNALQWRMLLWWLLALWLPTLLVTAPLWGALQEQWGHSPQAAAIAAAQDLPLLADAFVGIDRAMGGITVAALLATVLTLLLSPWLAGMVVASIRAGRRLGMGELMHGGLNEYGRMFRTLLWSILPLGVALGVGLVAVKMAGKQADAAILASQAETAGRIGLAVLAVLFVFAHMTVEAGRGGFGADVGLRSAIRAWWRGFQLVLRRPLASLTVYLGTSLVAYLLAALLGIWRLNTSGAGFGGFLLGLLLTQLVFVALAWGRIARLYGFSELAGAPAATSAAATTPATNTDEYLSMQQSEPAGT
ncbi:hypothetical protein M2650_06210 [Luteimonas sp. SX5]|uniref:YihY/virulence factor BrkB family protein n=1 Tax=Luteimonas galliterrae TaxID=2940486 RepID=A0ABT0MIW8_9GAMM|nr:hypothetical protein [Luteimonas galliterrae]MCL1634225.1 hypothetical protein [Luteimonas galliterrae]